MDRDPRDFTKNGNSSHFLLDRAKLPIVDQEFFILGVEINVSKRRFEDPTVVLGRKHKKGLFAVLDSGTLEAQIKQRSLGGC
jgi:hypothetical protein